MRGQETTRPDAARLNLETTDWNSTAPPRGKAGVLALIKKKQEFRRGVPKGERRSPLSGGGGHGERWGEPDAKLRCSCLLGIASIWEEGGVLYQTPVDGVALSRYDYELNNGER